MTPPFSFSGRTVTVIAKSLGKDSGTMLRAGRTTAESLANWNAGTPSKPFGPSTHATPSGRGIAMALVKSITFSSSNAPAKSERKHVSAAFTRLDTWVCSWVCPCDYVNSSTDCSTDQEKFILKLHDFLSTVVLREVIVPNLVISDTWSYINNPIYGGVITSNWWELNVALCCYEERGWTLGRYNW